MIKTLLLSVFLLSAFADSTWLGNWYVIRQYSAYLDKCDIPLNHTQAYITYSNDTLILSGTSAYDQLQKTWDLGWNASKPGGNVCSESGACVSGFVVTAKGIPYANISWNLPDHPYGTLWCSSLFVPGGPGEAEDSEDKVVDVTYHELEDEVNPEANHAFNQELVAEEPWFFVRNPEIRADQEFIKKQTE